MPPAPWTEHRDIAEAMAQAMVDALIAETGADMQLGNPTSFDPDEMLGPKPAPLRAYVVNFHQPLRDVLIVFTSLGRDLIEPMLPAGVRGALAAINVGSTEDEPTHTLDDVVEFDTIERAIDQSDALFLEASYEVSMPLGDLRVVFGTGLLESAMCHVNGVEDPWADGALLAAGAEDGARYDLGDQLEADVSDSAPVASTEPAPSALEAFDRELAEQEARADAIIAGLNPDVAVANMVTANEPQPAAVEQVHGAERWASLLSGVEVELSAELGRTDLELGDITTLVENRILTLDQMVEEPLTVFVNGTAYARARLVIVDGEYGIEILDILDQPEILGVNPIFSQIAA